MNDKERYELPLVSVGVLNFNRKDELRITLNRIMESSYPALEVIVADNGSTDGSVKMVKEEFPDVKIYELDHNTGVAARNNILFEATGKYIILYDDDSMPSTSITIREIVGFLEKYDHIAALCTNVKDYHTGISETQPWRCFAETIGDNFYEGAFIHGAGMAYRRDYIKQTRGFPEDFFWGLEEDDLTLQFISQDLKIVYTPDIVTYHRCSNTNRDNSWAFLMRTRNGLWLFWKYLPWPLASWLSLRYVLKQGIMAVGAIFMMREPAYLLSFLKGVYLGFRRAPGQRRKGELLKKEAITKTKGWRRRILSLFIYQRAAAFFRGARDGSIST